MARNEEKHFGRLNRLHLQQEREEYLKKYPKRPKLDTLNTVEDIQDWLPSIKQDIDFFLKQCKVPCYPEQKIAEFQHKVLRLEREYKAFVRKTRLLAPDLMVTPWTNRPYQSKKRNENSAKDSSSQSEDKFTKIYTPIMDSSVPVEDNQVSDLTCVKEDMMDKPLQFSVPNNNITETNQCNEQVSEVTNNANCFSNTTAFEKSLHFTQQDENIESKLPNYRQNDISDLSTKLSNKHEQHPSVSCSDDKSRNLCYQDEKLQQISSAVTYPLRNPLGLDYSSSESEGES